MRFRLNTKRSLKMEGLYLLMPMHGVVKVRCQGTPCMIEVEKRTLDEDKIYRISVVYKSFIGISFIGVLALSFRIITS